MAEKMKKPIVVACLALLCCLLWGSAFPCVKIGYEWFNIADTGSQLLFAGYRFTLAGILTFIIGSIIERRFLTMKQKAFPFIFAQGVLQTAIQYFCFYIGMAHTTGTKGSIINASNAFVSIVAAHFILKNEKMTSEKWLGCLLGIAGVITVNLVPGAWGSGFSLQGEGMVALCAIAYGLSTITLKKISHMDSPITITAYQLLFGGAMLLLIGKEWGGTMERFTIPSMLLLLYMALISTVAFCIWATLVKYNQVSKIAVYTFSIPIFGVILSGIFLGESVLTIQNLLALVLVSGGIILINKAKNEH